MKKAYALILTIIIISIFMYNINFIFQTKALASNNNYKHALYTQAKIHLDFLDTYIKSLNYEKNCYKHIKIKDKDFHINAEFDYDCKNYEKITIHLFVRHPHNTSLHKIITIK